MAVAWLLSMAIVKYPEQTKTYLQNSTLDTFTYNKTLQKACESKQISKEEKMILRVLTTYIKKEKYSFIYRDISLFSFQYFNA